MLEREWWLVSGLRCGVYQYHHMRSLGIPQYVPGGEPTILLWRLDPGQLYCMRWRDIGTQEAQSVPMNIIPTGYSHLQFIWMQASGNSSTVVSYTSTSAKLSCIFLDNSPSPTFGKLI